MELPINRAVECEYSFLIVDDNFCVRESLEQFIQSEYPHACISLAEDGYQAIALAKQNGPDIVIMDILMPVMDGISATYEIKKILPASQVIVLTMFEDFEYEARARAAGASAFVSKKQMGCLLISTINELMGAKKRIAKADEIMKNERKERDSDTRKIADELISTVASNLPKQAREMFRRERDRTQKYLDVAGVMFIVLDRNGDITLVNQKGCDILGYKKEEIIGKNWFNHFLPKETVKKVKAIFRELIEKGVEVAEYHENSVLNSSGGQRIIAWHNTILKDDMGNIVGTLSSGEDITERKRVQEELQESEKKYRTLFNHIADPVVIFDTQTHRFLDCNQAFLHNYGYTLEELKTMTPFNLHPPDEIERVKQTISKMNVDRGNIYKHFTKDGTHKVVEILSDGIDYKGKPAWISVIRDITECKLAEEALHKSERKYRGMIKNLMEGFYSASPEGKLLEYNNEACKIMGLDHNKDHVGYDLPNFWQKREDRAEYMKILFKNGFVKNYHLDAKKGDGEHIILQLNSRVIKDENSQPLRIEGTFLDITERMRAEEALKKSKMTLDKAQKIAKVGSWKWHTGTNEMEMSDGLYRILGLNKEDGVPPFDPNAETVHPDDRERMLDVISTALKNKEPYSLDYRIFRADDGEERHLHLDTEIERIPNSKDSIVYGMVQDVTENKQAEAAQEELLKDREERVKELQCIYGIADSIQRRSTLEEIFLDAVVFIPAGWLYPEITRCKVVYGGKEYVLEAFEATEWNLSAEIIVGKEPQGLIEVYYMEKRPEMDEGPFMKEERALITGIARQLGEAIEHKQTENELKEHRKNLVDLVKERTSELEKANTELKEKNRELERFFDATMDREIRMKELRDRVVELEKKIAEPKLGALK